MQLRIGSRGSQLALWQANHIAAQLRGRSHEVEIKIIHTTGDKITDVALAKVGAKGMFTKEMDLPTELSEQFEVAAILAREDPRDALCSKSYPSMEALPKGARIGTSSLRREAQLKAVRPDLVVHPLRGNVDTRLRKLEAGEYDAIILAAAGLRRLGRTELIRKIIPVEVMCPAAGQGALAIEIRAGDDAVREALLFLDDQASRAETECERALLKKLGGGCQVPIGASATLQDGTLHLQAIVANPDGTMLLRESATGSDPSELGEEVGDNLLRRGGDKILDQRPFIPINFRH